MTTDAKARVIAFYLPQFHPVSENDKAHGKGFTEWTNVAKAQPVFPGHVQPKIPADLGFYDLRVSETRIAQAELAKEYGVEGFCYWHYWLGNGRRLLERPFNEVLESGKPDYPFCLGWANHDWSGKGWMGGAEGDDIIQTYPGKDDALEHFKFLLKAFKDERYIKINDKPLLVIYRPREIPDCKGYLEYWRGLAKAEGFKDLHIIGDAVGVPVEQLGLDGALYSGQRHLPKDVWEKPTGWDSLHSKNLKKVTYAKVMKYLVKQEGFDNTDYPVIIPNWDTTPRLGDDAMIFYGNNPELFRIHVRQVLDSVEHRSKEDNVVFLRAWNEWAEGNYLEPDQEFGLGMLEALKSEVFN
ncbi:glycoside hydrolase family 99-like domain-containing protein [Aliiglaciecola sp. NS0011-25]|uniref:glycosyltransferase WbsX family protein n=1 Tax=Aliiglaciecola sp. NS0011-25 TaxID=3127654 RepID=UPI0031076A9D